VSVESRSSSAEQHVAVYDYGMGGVWVLIEAESREAVEERFPWLRVISAGDPPWITAEKYREIRDTWIPDSMKFKLSAPAGWLAESDRTLGLGGTRPDRRPRIQSDPPAPGAMRYQRIVWASSLESEPVHLYAEIDSDGYEVRKVDEYRNGHLDRADRNGGSGSTFVSDYYVPEIERVSAIRDFEATAISADEFETVWRRAARQGAPGP
jgi:hypothetical protein